MHPASLQGRIGLSTIIFRPPLLFPTLCRPLPAMSDDGASPADDTSQPPAPATAPPEPSNTPPLTPPASKEQSPQPSEPSSTAEDVEEPHVSTRASSNTTKAKPTTNTNGSSEDPALLPRRTKRAKTRRLKLYGCEEKLDIIDYAKVIGNRAAGREFNVAESSIREWRKNEDRLRQQMRTGVAGTTGGSECCPPPASATGTATAGGGMLRFEEANPELVAELDRVLVGYVLHEQGAANGGGSGGVGTEGASNGKGKGQGGQPAPVAVDWYAIRRRAEELWTELARHTDSTLLPPMSNAAAMDGGSVITMVGGGC